MLLAWPGECEIICWSVSMLYIVTGLDKFRSATGQPFSGSVAGTLMGILRYPNPPKLPRPKIRVEMDWTWLNKGFFWSPRLLKKALLNPYFFASLNSHKLHNCMQWVMYICMLCGRFLTFSDESKVFSINLDKYICICIYVYVCICTMYTYII